jgi:hypothetical protein
VPSGLIYSVEFEFEFCTIRFCSCGRTQVASGFETVRDINDASRLIGDAFRSTLLDDPLSECYKKLSCSISAVAEGSEDYKMVLKYLEKTYEPVKVEDVVRLPYTRFRSAL